MCILSGRPPQKITYCIFNIQKPNGKIRSLLRALLTKFPLISCGNFHPAFSLPHQLLVWQVAIFPSAVVISMLAM
jgi:hypothetical protein